MTVEELNDNYTINTIIPEKIKGTGFFTPIDIPPPNTKDSVEIEKPYEDRTEEKTYPMWKGKDGQWHNDRLPTVDDCC